MSAQLTDALSYVRVRLGRYWIVLPLAFFVVWTFTPFLWTLFGSFKSQMEIYNSRSLLPQEPNLDAYVTVMNSPGFWRFMLNSTIVSVVSTILATFISFLAAYGFARYAFAFRHWLLLLILVPRIIPRVSLIVPLYDIVVAAGLLNTYTALIVAYTATAIPLATWLLVGFIHGVPRSLEEAAEIDGAGFWRRLFVIVAPLAWPGIAAVMILTLQEGWNEFPFALAFTTTAEMRTLPYQLFLLRDTIGIQDWSIINAFTVLTIIPIIVVFLFFQKYMVQGMMSGAVK